MLKSWSKFAKVYDPIKCGSIDGIDCEPHDRAVIRAINNEYRPNKFVKGKKIWDLPFSWLRVCIPS